MCPRWVLLWIQFISTNSLSVPTYKWRLLFMHLIKTSESCGNIYQALFCTQQNIFLFMYICRRSSLSRLPVPMIAQACYLIFYSRCYFLCICWHLLYSALLHPSIFSLVVPPVFPAWLLTSRRFIKPIWVTNLYSVKEDSSTAKHFSCSVPSPRVFL